MIKKLESAGLGFYVKATETQHKLGMYILRNTEYVIDPSISQVQSLFVS